MHVQPLGLESGESAGHREELFAHRGEMVQPLLQTEVGQVIGAGLVAQIGRELLVLLDEGVAIVGAEDVMAMLDLLDDRVQLALQFFGDALPEDLGDLVGRHAPHADFTAAFEDPPPAIRYIFLSEILMTRTRPRLVFALLFTAALAFAQRGPVPQQLVFTPYHASGIYDIGETVGWTVMPGPVAPTYLYKWTVRRNNAVVLKEGKLDLSSGKDKIEITADQPEMIYVAVEAYANLNGEAPTPVSPPAPPGASAAGPGRAAAPLFVGGNTGRHNGVYAVGAAVAPLKIGLSTPRPADFDAFWDAKLAAQAQVPINPVLTSVQTDVPGVEMSMFVLDALGSKAHGYLAKPAKEGKFPAVIQLQYAGVYALNAGAVAQRAAEGWLMINVDSHDKLPSDPSGDIPRAYQAVGNTDRENSYFLNMYLRDSRALDYLLTRPDWDGKTIVLTGGSMGGQQSLILAGLRPEIITSALVCVPAGADSNGDLHGRKAGYPNWASDEPEVMKTALYFDTANFASRIESPVMAGFGFIDTTSPPAGVWTMLNQIPVPKEPLPMIESDHDNFTPRSEGSLVV